MNRKTNKAHKDKILIVVLGGVVQGVFSSSTNIEIDLLDYDNEEFASDELAMNDFENRKNNLKRIL